MNFSHSNLNGADLGSLALKQNIEYDFTGADLRFTKLSSFGRIKDCIINDARLSESNAAYAYANSKADGHENVTIFNDKGQDVTKNYTFGQRENGTHFVGKTREKERPSPPSRSYSAISSASSQPKGNDHDNGIAFIMGGIVTAVGAVIMPEHKDKGQPEKVNPLKIALGVVAAGLFIWRKQSASTS